MIKRIVSYFRTLTEKIAAAQAADEAELKRLIELAKQDPDFAEIAKLYATYTMPEDIRRARRVLKSILKDVQEIS